MMNKIFFLIAMVVVFYISINTIQKFSINYETLEELISEFKTGYIEDIKVIANATSQTKCPNNYTTLVDNFDWPGNFKGCGCIKDDNSGQYQFYKDTCPISKQCKTFEETNEVNLNIWKNNLLCYKRSNISYDKLKLVSYENRESCNNSTHRICGIIDGQDNLLCLEKGKNCPVTKIVFSHNKKIEQNITITTNTSLNNITISNNSTLPKQSNTTISNNGTLPQQSNTTISNNTLIPKNNNTISTNSSITNQTRILTENYSTQNSTRKSFQLNEDTLITISHEELLYSSPIPPEDNNIIFSFFRTDLTKPCFNPKRSPSSENFFPMMKNKFDLMCDKYENGTEITDDSFQVLDQYNLDDYYKNNSFYTNVHKLIDPFKIDISKEKIKIYGRGYPGWSLQCQNSNPEALQSFLIMSNELNQISISIIIHSFISLAILISIGVLACFVSQYFELMFLSAQLGFVVFNLIFPIQIISNSNWVINILADEYGALCGDKIFNMLLMDITNSCLGLQYSFIIVLLVAILCSIVFIYVLYSWIKPATREVQETLIQMK